MILFFKRMAKHMLQEMEMCMKVQLS